MRFVSKHFAIHIGRSWIDYDTVEVSIGALARKEIIEGGFVYRFWWTMRLGPPPKRLEQLTDEQMYRFGVVQSEHWTGRRVQPARAVVMWWAWRPRVYWYWA